jgi:predicted nucleic acid-binding protein
VYWDSCVYIDCIQRTPGRWEHLEPVLRQAERGSIVLVASALVIAEVVKCPEVPIRDDDKIRDFFENDFIKFRNVDRATAEAAARISREHGVKPPDAIHVATAIITKCDCLQTFDGMQRGGKRLLSFNGVIGLPPLKIEIPSLVRTDGVQQNLFEFDPTIHDSATIGKIGLTRDSVDWLMLRRRQPHPMRRVSNISRSQISFTSARRPG